MMEFSEVEVTRYNYDTKEVENLGKVDLGRVAKAVQPGHIAYFLSSLLNGFGSAFNQGRAVGQLCGDGNFHRTIQGCLVNFCLGILVGFAEVSDPRYTDPRNQAAVETAHQVKRDVENGHLGKQSFI